MSIPTTVLGVRSAKTTIQLPNSTVPWKTLYSVANAVLPSPMFRSQQIGISLGRCRASARRCSARPRGVWDLLSPSYPAPLFACFFSKCKKLNPLLSNRSALFKKVYSANSFAIKGFRTLLQNTRVAPTLDRFSTPPCNPSQKGTPASPLPATLAAPVTNKSIVCRSYRNTGGVRPSVCRNAHTTLCKLSVKRRQKRFSDFENYRQY